MTHVLLPDCWLSIPLLAEPGKKNAITYEQPESARNQGLRLAGRCRAEVKLPVCRYWLWSCRRRAGVLARAGRRRGRLLATAPAPMSGLARPVHSSSPRPAPRRLHPKRLRAPARPTGARHPCTCPGRRRYGGVVTSLRHTPRSRQRRPEPPADPCPLANESDQNSSTSTTGEGARNG